MPVSLSEEQAMTPSFQSPDVTELTPSSADRPEVRRLRTERLQPHLLPASLRSRPAEHEPSSPRGEDKPRETRSFAELLSCLM